ncbi:hypothetical protein [Pseudonocardia oroxyli]|uniref:Uncharacterized protein n=1 Tax=Pseudonocardia oroxyli TaxID=366584 RepID=A0A1G7TGR7_PSEOR|nr:hypothetical protein [Pseudonocardia oroxyli]SDG33740.1 hypothetical protein SAMN05216377_1116 [Pseudonocardia oroxyli]
MTGPDYPLLTIPGQDLFQMAHVAAFIADRLHRHKGAVDAHDRQGRREAARDVHAGRAAFAKLVGDPDAVSAAVPRPLDQATYEEAEKLAARGENRTATVVSLAPLGRTTWAALGQAPGIGQLGAEVPNRELAEAVAEQMRTAPRQDLLPWQVSREPLGLGTDRWGTADEDAAVKSLDPAVAREAAVAGALGNPPANSAAAAASAAMAAPTTAAAAPARTAPTPASAISAPKPSAAHLQR